jgi:protein TonB
MDTRYNLDARRRARGAIRPVTLAVIAVIAALAAAAWFLIIKPHEDMLQADSTPHPTVPVAAASAVAPPPADVGSMGLNELLSEARKAINEQRYLAPSGNNAFEFYLTALQKQPGNQVATDALRETFPFAASSAEQAINQRDFNEAQRQIDLLAKADPANYTLTILRSKLDAQRKLLDKEQQDQLDQQKQQQLAQQKAVAEKAAAEKLAAEQAQQTEQATEQKAAAAAVAERRRQAAAQTEPVASKSSAAEPAQGAAGETTPPVLIRSFQPRYPTQARRAGQNGWVVVSFTVTTDGNTSNLKVADAEPRHVFERSALDAVERWKFSPAMKDGQAVESQRTQRIVFNMNQQP